MISRSQASNPNPARAAAEGSRADTTVSHTPRLGNEGGERTPSVTRALPSRARQRAPLRGLSRAFVITPGGTTGPRGRLGASPAPRTPEAGQLGATGWEPRLGAICPPRPRSPPRVPAAARLAKGGLLIPHRPPSPLLTEYKQLAGTGPGTAAGFT